MSRILYTCCERLNIFLKTAHNNITLLQTINEFQDELTICPDEVRTFLNDILFYLEQQLLTEVSKIFDSESTNKHKNCSILALKSQLEMELSSHEELKKYLTEIENINDLYEKSNVKHIRNKQLAHHDEATLDEGKSTFISLAQIIELVLKAEKIIEMILYEQYGVTFSENDKEKLYRKALFRFIERE